MSRDRRNIPLPSSPRERPKAGQRSWLRSLLQVQPRGPRGLFRPNHSSTTTRTRPLSASSSLSYITTLNAAAGRDNPANLMHEFDILAADPPTMYRPPEPPRLAKFEQPVSPPLTTGYSSVDGSSEPPPERYRAYGSSSNNQSSLSPPPVSRYAQPTSPIPSTGYETSQPQQATLSEPFFSDTEYQNLNDVNQNPQQIRSTSGPRIVNPNPSNSFIQYPHAAELDASPLREKTSVRSFRPGDDVSLPISTAEAQEIHNRSKESTKLGRRSTTAQPQVSSVSRGSHGETQASKASTKPIEASPNTESQSESVSMFALPEVFIDAGDPSGQHKILEGIGFSPLYDRQNTHTISESLGRDLATAVETTVAPADDSSLQELQKPPRKQIIKEDNRSPSPVHDQIRPVDETAEESEKENNQITTPMTRKQRPAALTTSPSDYFPAAMDPLAPPVSRNPLASPLPKTQDFFPQFGASPLLTPSRDTVESPLVPPPSPFLGQHLNAEDIRAAPSKGPAYYDTSKPTCTLNLVCYRYGTKGCELHQIQAAKRSRFKSEGEFQKLIKDNPELITTDEQFFYAVRKVYLRKMCSFWRRIFFFKTLRGLRLLSVGKFLHCQFAISCA
jgi:hypothetical protein